jgi:hypothetical protein
MGKNKFDGKDSWKSLEKCSENELLERMEKDKKRIR